jgi:hypothetical protein
MGKHAHPTRTSNLGHGRVRTNNTMFPNNVARRVNRLDHYRYCTPSSASPNGPNLTHYHRHPTTNWDTKVTPSQTPHLTFTFPVHPNDFPSPRDTKRIKNKHGETIHFHATPGCPARCPNLAIKRILARATQLHHCRLPSTLIPWGDSNTSPTKH